MMPKFSKLVSTLGIFISNNNTNNSNNNSNK